VPTVPQSSAPTRQLLPLCATHGRGAVGRATLLVSGLRSDLFGIAGGSIALPAAGRAASGGFFQCAGGDRVWTRSAAWRARSRMSASGLDSISDQSLHPKGSLWSTDSERDFRGGAAVETVAPGQRNPGGDFGVLGSNAQPFAVGGLPVPAFAPGRGLSRGAVLSGEGPTDPTQGFVFPSGDPGASWRA